MQDQQDWMDPNRPVRNTDDPQQEDVSEDAMDNVVYRNGSDAGKKGGEAGRPGFNSNDTSDYGTDSSVDTQDQIGIGDANNDRDEEDMDASDELMNSDEDRE